MLTVATVLMSVTIAKARGSNEYEQTPQHRNSQTSGASQPPPWNTNSNTLTRDFTQEQPYEVRIVATPQKDGWDKAVVYCDLLLAAVGAGGICLTWRTIQTSSAAAQAALLSAQSYINAERPWMQPTVEQEKRADGSFVPDTFHIAFYNVGRTPAKIVGGSFEYTFVSDPDKLPVPPVYVKPIVLPSSPFILNKDSFPLKAKMCPATLVVNNGKETLIENRAEFLVYYGNVLYEDTFTVPGRAPAIHETRWCLVYVPSLDPVLYSSGPEKYSGHY